MIVQEAVSAIVRKLFELDRRELLAGHPRLCEQDKTWGEWAGELQARVNYLMVSGPSQDVLDSLAALVLAMKIRLAEQESMSPTSGEAA